MKSVVAFVLTVAIASSTVAYEVRLPPTPQSWEKTAAEELKSYLGRLAEGNSVKVAGEEAVFHVGDTDFAREKRLGAKDLHDEQWVVRSFGRDVVLVGGGTRGTLYATYHFLEDCCGVRWWSDTEEDVPSTSVVAFEKLDSAGKPAFAYRDFHFDNRNGTRTTRNAIRFRLNRVNGLQIPLSLGGALEFGPPKFVHTFDEYIPAAEYLETHPEYFSQIGDKRVGGVANGQLCLSNPDVKRILTEKLFAFIEAGETNARAHGWAIPRIYDISENDNGNFCACAKCRTERERYGLSGQYIRFLNGIAAELKAKRPDLMLATLAYLMQMEPPPKDPDVKAADNLIVRLCDTRGNQASSILEDLPFPSEFHYGDLYRFYRDHGVTGVFWEHEYPQTSDMFELKLFLELKLMENPDLDCNELIGRFMHEYYGKAAPAVLRVRQHLDKIRRARKAFVNWNPSVGAYSYIEDDDIIRCEKAFDLAEAAVAGDEKLLHRVRRARRTMDRLALTRAPNENLVRHNIEKPVISPEFVTVIEAARLRLGKPSVAVSVPKKVPPPPQFAARRYYDFYADMFKPVYTGNPKLVDDLESPTKRASRLDVDAQAQSTLPLRLAYWNATEKRETRRTDIGEIDTAPGYHWYHMGEVTVAPEGYIYLNRSWLPQLVVSTAELVGRTFDVWASVKFEGPRFRPGDTLPNAQYVDRVILFVTDDK